MTAEIGAQQFTAEHLTDWASRGEVLLRAARHDIDALNVFPVPDGDTGTNLLLTWQAASEALAEAVALPAQSEAGPAAASAAWSRGALLGARGNSGVIVAQLLRGIAETFAPPRRWTGQDRRLSAEAGATLAAALDRAAELGYAGVARPVEGTILTVAAAAARGAAEHSTGGLAAVAAAAAESAADALALTPGSCRCSRQQGSSTPGDRDWC